MIDVCLVGMIVAIALPALAAADGDPARILVIDSYHREYAWSAGIRQGIANTLDLPSSSANLVQSRDGSLVVRTAFMDTKRRPKPEERQAAADRVLAVIDDWQPDLVIACDDNAVKDIVVPHLLGRDMPVVFCGVNWDASVYGLPDRNVTGMVEIDQIPDLLAILRAHAAGERLGILQLDTVTSRRDVEGLRKYFGLDPTVRLVADLTEWKEAFVAMQDEVDMLMIKQNITAMPDWDLDEMVAFCEANTRIPTGTTTEPVSRCVLVSIIKNPQEQGIWAAQTALAILAGTAPADMPLAANRESRVVLNMGLAKRLGIRFEMELIDRATFVEEIWRP